MHRTYTAPSPREKVVTVRVSDWQKERAAGPLQPMRTGSEFTGRRALLMWSWWLLIVTIAACAAFSR